MDAKQIAQELGVRYVLMGSVRRANDRVRVGAQLIDGCTGGNVWARSYDRAVSDIFAVQDEITQMIVGAIEPELSRAERERARVKTRHSLDAWTIYQHGMFHLYRCTREDLIEARKRFREAVAIDPEFGPAYSAEAEAYYYEVVYGFVGSNRDSRDNAIGPARRAVTLDGEELERTARWDEFTTFGMSIRRPLWRLRPPSNSIPVSRSAITASGRR
jgi:hypothetical protein